MDIRKLEYFEAVSRLGSFTKAAEELYVAQPSISGSIKSLEDELGVKLFARDNRNVALTYEGEFFRVRVVEILKLLDSTVDEMNSLSKKRNNILNIGIPPIVGSDIIVKLLGDFQRKYPQIKIHILQLGSYGILKAIEEDEIDLGFHVFSEEMDERFETILLYESDIKVVLSKNNPLAKKDILDIKDISKEKLIYLPEDTYLRKRIDAEFKKNNIVPDILFISRQMISTMNLVAQNLGISFVLGNPQVLNEIESLTLKSFKDPIKFKCGFSWKKDKLMSDSMKRCIKFIESV